jgi:hypothetical protein
VRFSICFSQRSKEDDDRIDVLMVGLYSPIFSIYIKVFAPQKNEKGLHRKIELQPVFALYFSLARASRLLVMNTTNLRKVVLLFFFSS